MAGNISKNSLLILIIDDDLISLIMLEKFLNREGYRTISSTNGLDTVNLAFKYHPDLILLDVNLPDERGPDICRKLKLNSALSDIPVIFLSVDAELQSKIECFEAGGQDYITKPYEPREVLVRVKTHLRLYTTQNMLIEMFSSKINEVGKAQKALLPPEPCEIPDAKFGVYYHQLSAAGGDLYDIIKVGEDVYDYITADVCGHDLGIALITAAIKTLLIQNCTLLNTPSEILHVVNKILPSVLASGQYVCFSWIRLNRSTGQAYLLNAGQPPIIYLPKGECVSKIEMTGDIVGIFENVTFEENVLTVEKGDKFLMYSDGLIEIGGKNPSDRSSGIERVITICEKCKDYTIDTMLKEIKTSELNFEPDDDIIVMAVEV